MSAHWISTSPLVVYPPMSHRVQLALYIPSFYLSRGGGQFKLLCRVFARMDCIVPGCSVLLLSMIMVFYSFKQVSACKIILFVFKLLPVMKLLCCLLVTSRHHRISSSYQEQITLELTYNLGYQRLFFLSGFLSVLYSSGARL